MTKFRGVEKNELVQSIEDAMDFILSKSFNQNARKDLSDWIDGRKLAVLKQSSSDEELARNVKLMGADKVFEPFRDMLERVYRLDVTPQSQKMVENLKKWSAYSPS